MSWQKDWKTQKNTRPPAQFIARPMHRFFFRDEMMVLAWKSFKAKQQQRKLMKQLYWWCSRVTTARAKAVVHRWWWWRDSGGVRSAIIDVRAKEETNKRQQYWKKHLESSGSTHYKVSTNPPYEEPEKKHVFLTLIPLQNSVQRWTRQHLPGDGDFRHTPRVWGPRFGPYNQTWSKSSGKIILCSRF